MHGEEANFAARLDEGIGCWSQVLAISPNPEDCCDLTDVYLRCRKDGGRASNRHAANMDRWRSLAGRTTPSTTTAIANASTDMPSALERLYLEQVGWTSNDVTKVM